MVTTLRTLARLPELIATAAEATSVLVQRLAALEPAITSRLIDLDRGVRDIANALPALADDLIRVRSTVEPQYERVTAIEANLAILPELASSLEQLRTTAAPQVERITPIEESLTRLEAQINILQRTLSQLKGDVEDATEHLPDPDAPGPLARARDALTGGS
jgi:chromosome segregation ATPase